MMAVLVLLLMAAAAASATGLSTNSNSLVARKLLQQAACGKEGDPCKSLLLLLMIINVAVASSVL